MRRVSIWFLGGTLLAGGAFGGGFTAMPDGACPVLEAVLPTNGGRVGVPLACLANPDGVHRVMLNLTKDVDLTVSVFQNKGHNVEPGDKHYCVDICRKRIPPVMAI